MTLTVNPLTPLCAGTFRDGVFKSTDMGATWVTINIGLTGFDIQALAVDPLTPTTIYAGTGDGGAFVFQTVPFPIPSQPQ